MSEKVRAIETIPSMLVAIEAKEAQLDDVLSALRADVRDLREKPLASLNDRSYAEVIKSLSDEITKLKNEVMLRARSPDQLMFVFD